MGLGTSGNNLPLFEGLGIINSMGRALIGKYKKHLQNIQVATTISVASMSTLDSDTDELQDHISVLDQGVDKAPNVWLE